MRVWRHSSVRRRAACTITVPSGPPLRMILLPRILGVLLRILTARVPTSTRRFLPRKLVMRPVLVLQVFAVPVFFPEPIAVIPLVAIRPRFLLVIAVVCISIILALRLSLWRRLLGLRRRLLAVVGPLKRPVLVSWIVCHGVRIDMVIAPS